MNCDKKQMHIILFYGESADIYLANPCGAIHSLTLQGTGFESSCRFLYSTLALDNKSTSLGIGPFSITRITEAISCPQYSLQ